MSIWVAALISVIACTGCAKPGVSAHFSEPPPAFKVRTGGLLDFGNRPLVCLHASDQETGVDLTALAVSTLSRELPGFSNSCGAPGVVLVATLQTGFTAYTHSSNRGPRFGFGHVGRTAPKGSFVAEAEVWDNTAGSRDDNIKRLAKLLADFLKAARD